MTKYIHGYTEEEQKRLLAQAAFWRDSLILPGLEFPKDAFVLEVGCGAGAVLGVLSEAFPELHFSGLDLEARQIAFAQSHLEGRRVDLRQGNALALPWDEGTFDAVYMIWFLEHLPDPMGALKEAYRVLRPGSKVWAHETDYQTLKLSPSSPAIEAMLAAYRKRFAEAAWIDAGRRMDFWMREAGFAEVQKTRMGFSWDAGKELERSVEYLLGFIEPTLGRQARGEFRVGIQEMRDLGRRPDGKLSIDVFRCLGIKAS